MYRTLLVPLDGSPFAEQALPAACILVRRARARLRLVHVHQRSTPTPISIARLPVIDERLNSLRRDHERAYLAHVRDCIAAELPGIDIATHLLEPVEHDTHDETVVRALAAYAATAAVDLVVMTTHGHCGLARFLIGSVATTLTRHCPAPLLLVRPGIDGVVARRTFRRILVPLDGSKVAERMVYRALTLGRLLAADYVLLRVVEPATPFGITPSVEPIDLGPNRMARLCVEAQADLDRVVNWMRVAGATVSAHVRVAPHPAHTILEAAEELGADVIAMATYARSGWRRILLGSVTDKVVRDAHLLVLVYASEALHADEATHKRIQLR